MRQAQVVQRMDIAVHRINHYPLYSVDWFVNTYQLDSDLSGRQHYPAFEQLPNHNSYWCFSPLFITFFFSPLLTNNLCIQTRLFYSATTWTGPLQTKLTNQSVNWEQRMATVFLNRPMKLKNSNSGVTTKIWNPTKMRRVADVSGNFVTFWLVRFDPIFWNFFRLFNVSNGFGKL